MRKIIAGLNMTLDGVCDHTKGIFDDEIHQYYADMLRDADAILFGRITYQLMEFWKTVIDNPTGNPSMDDFAIAIDRIPKIVFSRTLTDVDWKSARVATLGLGEEILALKQQPGNNILIGSRSLIIALMKLGLLDELHLTVYPMIAGNGLAFFEGIHDQKVMKLLKTKTFACGAVTLYYQP